MAQPRTYVMVSASLYHWLVLFFKFVNYVQFSFSELHILHIYIVQGKQYGPIGISVGCGHELWC